MTNVTITQGRHPFTGRLEPYSGTGLSAYKLAAGHYVTKQFDMNFVSPRPDSETGSYSGTVIARHRWAYYDGVNPVRYEFPVIVFGGATPHIFELLRAPAGATIGNNITAADHGVIKWNPTQAFSTSSPAVFTVRVYDQDMTYVEMTWTVATSSSTTKFLFLNADTGNDTTGTGSISAPFQTIAKVTGTSISSVTYPARIVYMRGTTANYTTMYHNDHPIKGSGDGTDKYICYLDKSKVPIVFVAFPDESVTIDFSASEYRLLDGSHDFGFFGSSTAPLQLLGSATLAYESHNIWLEQAMRISFCWITIDNFIPRNRYHPALTGWTNFSPIFSPYTAVGGESEAASTRRYIAMHSVNEINRATAYPNDASIITAFGTHSTVMQFCSIDRQVAGGSQGVNFKDSNWSTSVRYCDLRAENTYPAAITFSDQTNGGDNEVVYTKIKNRVFFNQQNTTTVGKVGIHYAGRCSIYTNYSGSGAGNNKAIRAWGNAGATYTAENCVLVAYETPAYQSANGITSTGNEAHQTSGSADQPLDTTTMLLKNSTTQYRTLYLGTRGAEIA